MVISKISASYNIAIPREIRLAVNLQPGDILEFYVQEDGSIVLKKEASFDHNTTQTALPAFEWVFEDEEEEDDVDDDDDDDCSSCLTSTEVAARR